MVQQVRLRPFISSALLIASGAISALGFAPYHYQFLTVIGFSYFFYVLMALSSSKKAFWDGWLFGVGFNITSLYWIGHSFITANLWYLAPLGIVIFPCLMAFFPALVSFFTVHFTSHKFERFFAFCFVWSLSEWVKGWIFTGFPWTLLGYIWNIEILQSTAYIGIYGLSALSIFLLSVIGTQSWRLLGIALTVYIGLYAQGFYRLSSVRTEETDINIRLVQASIPQTEKWQTEFFEKNLQRWLTLSKLPAERPLHLVIWAESSVPAFVADLPLLRNVLAQGIPSNGYLLIGAPLKIKGEGQKTLYKTSTFALDEKGTIVASYDKVHLVPFGEYIPFKQYLGFSKLTAGTENYSPGHQLESMNLNKIPLFVPLICYEAIFPGQVIPAGSRPQWLMNQTNDAWFGDSVGPYQHLAIVRVRAIEEGLPLVRCANNGISAVINPLGNILHRLELNEVGFIDFALPKSLPQPTFFSHFPQLGFLILIMAYFLLTIFFRRIKKT